jgi:hypothetical protein
MFKKWDIIIIIFLICLSLIPELIFGVVLGKNYNRTYAEISVNGNIVKKILLSEHRGDEKIDIKTASGYNTLEIKDQSIKVIDADCRDKICEKSDFISERGQIIVCLPHKLMVEIKSTDIMQNN